MKTVDSQYVEHKDLKAIVRAPEATRLLDVCKVERDCVDVLPVDLATSI